MAHENVEVAVEARLRAAWADRTPIFTENDRNEEQPSDGVTSFLSLQFPVSDAQRWSVGTRYYREEGAFRIVMSVPQGIGKDKIRDWGSELGALFRDVKFDGVETQVPSSPIPVGREDGASYYVLALVCPYSFNFRA